MVYSLRSLLVSFTIILMVALTIVFNTFSTLRSQEREQVKIERSRDVLQKLGSAISNMQEFENLRANYVGSRHHSLLERYNTALQHLRTDSVNLSGLALSHTEDSASYHQLTGLIHRMITYASTTLQRDSSRPPNIKQNGIAITTDFKDIADSLEAENRAILNTSYAHSIDLTRRTFTFVRIIFFILVLVVIVSFYTIYRDTQAKKKIAEQLKQFNTELERQVNLKTAEIGENEKKYHSLFESMSDAFAKTDMQGRFIEFNTAYRNMLGYTAEEIYQLNFKDITPEKWLKMEEDILVKQVLRRGYSDVFEKEYIHKSGRVFPVELRTFLLKNQQGEPVAMWAIIRDISRRKEGERRLEDSEKNLRQVLSSISDNFYVIDRNCRVILINETAERNLEKAWGSPVTVGTNILDLIPSEKEEPIRASLVKVFAGKHVEYELYNRIDELPAWVLVTYAPVADESGKITGAYIVAKDITQRKKAELELVEAEAKFRNLVEQSLVGVFIIKDGKLAYVNPRFAEMFGYNQYELFNTDPFIVIHPDQRERAKEIIFSRIPAVKESIHYEAKGIKKNGDHIWTEIFCSGTVYEGVSAIIGTILDITDRKIADEEKDWARYLLNERIKELTTLYRASRIIQTEEKPAEEILAEIIQILPSAWRHSEVAAARLTFGKMDIQSPNFAEGFHGQTTTFPVPGGTTGTLEVVYLEKKAEPGKDPFLQEEQDLLNMMAEMIRLYLARRHEAEALKRSEMEVLNQKVQAQKAITRAVLNAEESERNKIGQELHDNVNQIMVSIKLYLSLAQEKEMEDGRELIKNSIKLVDNAINEIRALSKSQVTPVKEVNLEELIQSLVDKLDDSTSIVTRFDYSLNGMTIADDLKLNIYRITQEQINNILKHADASNIAIEVRSESDYLQLNISDDGKGFDPTRKRKGIGISNMINRVESFNGDLSIKSSPGKGCRIEIRIPLASS